MTIAANVERAVATRVGAITLVGSIDPAADRRAMTVTGTMVKEEVVKATKVHMASEAVPGSVFSSSSFPWYVPRGVAACQCPGCWH